MSLSDGAPMMTMPVAPANSYGGGMGMWGENWIWIIVLFLFGWGRNGWGNNAGNSGGVVDGYVLTSDFANVERLSLIHISRQTQFKLGWMLTLIGMYR